MSWKGGGGHSYSSWMTTSELISGSALGLWLLGHPHRLPQTSSIVWSVSIFPQVTPLPAHHYQHLLRLLVVFNSPLLPGQLVQSLPSAPHNIGGICHVGWVVPVDRM